MANGIAKILEPFWKATDQLESFWNTQKNLNRKTKLLFNTIN